MPAVDIVRGRGLRLCLTLAAAVLVVETLARALPSALPPSLRLTASLRLLDREIYSRDPELGHCLKARFKRLFDMKGLRLEVRHEALPGGAPCGYRTAPRGGGADRPDADQTRADIVVLGDSHVYGMEVDEESTWVSLLGRRSGLRAANLGVRMYGTTQAVELYRRYGSRLQPRLVLLLICPNDPWDNAVFEDWRAHRNIPPAMDSDEMLYRVCRTLRLESAPLACRAVARFGMLGLLPHLLLGRSVALLYGRSSMETISSERLALVGRDLRALRESARGPRPGAGGATVAAIINEGWAPGPRKALVRILEDGRIPFLNISGETGAAGKRLHVALDGHWNAAGHRRTAELVYRFLEQRKLLPTLGSR